MAFKDLQAGITDLFNEHQSGVDFRSTQGLRTRALPAVVERAARSWTPACSCRLCFEEFATAESMYGHFAAVHTAVNQLATLTNRRVHAAYVNSLNAQRGLSRAQRRAEKLQQRVARLEQELSKTLADLSRCLRV